MWKRNRAAFENFGVLRCINIEAIYVRILLKVKTNFCVKIQEHKFEFRRNLDIFHLSLTLVHSHSHVAETLPQAQECLSHQCP